MQKSQFVEYVALKNQGPIPQYTKMFNEFIKGMIEQFKRGEEINIVGFGRFYVRKTKGGKGTNFKTGEKIEYGPSRIAAFSQGPYLKRALNAKAKQAKKSKKTGN